ncbi:MAG: hypothetical protein Ta2E_00380 [Mycoplasmoidaceae bacterium]|nr:MAG: hypothetical protein Ta2E_00380 [Mycoplasmoidaceae bacterium]
MIIYQGIVVQILSDIYRDDCITDNHKSILSDLLERKINMTDIDEKTKIKRQINFIHRLLLMKEKLKNVIKTRDELDTFLEYNEPVLFGYHKRRSDDCYFVGHRKTYDVNFANLLYGVQIKSMGKSVMYSYFDYWDKNNITVYYWNPYSILIWESDLVKLKHFFQMNTVK